MKTLLVLAAGIPAALVVAASAGGSRQAAPRLNALDVAQLSTSIQGDRFEISGGRLALQLSGSPVVKALGARLVLDHSKSLADAARVAHSLGLGVPTVATPSERWELKQIASMSGAEFDRAYTSLEIADHTQDILETKTELHRGFNPAIKGLAKEDLPMLKRHLALSQRAWRVAVGE
jgi:putative membrane protein